MRKVSFLIIILLASVTLFGCNSNEATTVDIPSEHVPLSPFGEYEQIGEIIGFGPGTVDLLYNGRLITYPIATMEAPDLYLGETVGVTKIENALLLDESVYKLTPIIQPDTDTRKSSMGETIHQLSGVIQTVNKNNFSIQTNEGLLWIETYDNQDLIENTEMKIDYLNWGDHLMMVHCYDESLRFLFTITEKERSESGNLILTGTMEDETTLSISLATSTVKNFSIASLELGNTLAVYPQEPLGKKDKTIHPKRVDRIQYRTYRTTIEPILE